MCDNRSLMELVDITHKHGHICDHMLVPVQLSHNGCVAEMKWHCRINMLFARFHPDDDDELEFNDASTLLGH